jgi:hypothetical protein
VALDFAHGVVQWLAADGVSTVYSISGLAFQPKALRFTIVGIASATDAATAASSGRRGMGVAVSPSSRRSIATFSEDAVAAANCGSAWSNDCVVSTCDGSAARTGRLDLDVINASGFDLIVDDATPVDLTVGWEAWGGSDITVAAVGDIAEPAATGDQDYTVTGFVAGATDQVVMFAGCQSTGAVNTAVSQDSGFHVGFATASNNMTVCGNADDGSATMDTDGYGRNVECLSMVVIAGGTTMDALATLTQFGTDNFRLNWSARAVTDRRSIFLAIKGGQWTVGAYNIDGTTLNATATVSGLPYAPVGVVFVGARKSSVAPQGALDSLMFGVATSTSSRRSMGYQDQNSTADSALHLVVDYDSVLSYPASGALAAAYDLNAMNSDGFQVIVDLAGGIVNELQGYLTFGSAAAGGGRTTKNTRAFPLGMEIGMNRVGGLA